VPGLHPGERRRRRGGLVAFVVALGAVTAACSGSSHPSAASTTTATVASSSTTLPPAPSSTSVSVANGVVTIKGRGDRTVPIPAAIALPAIAHAHYTAKGSFLVSSVDGAGRRLAVLASSLGPYDGTFPVGFVDPADDPTANLRISTLGPWEIDIGSALLAPRLASGQSGLGDTVMAYEGPAATAHLTYRGHATLTVNLYENGGLIPLVHTRGPYDGPISLVAGPAFIAVTTTGNWSMIIE
jgi:hypothetical protein